MSNLSKGELCYFKESLKKGCRFDGRNLCDIRPFKFEYDQILFPNALYGVTVQVPDSKNAIMIGLNANIIQTKDSFSADDYISLSIVPSNLKAILDSQNTSMGMTISEIEDLLKKFVFSKMDFGILSLHENKLHWKIDCSVFVIGHLHINDLDYIFKGIKLCLVNCLFPKVQISFNNWTEEFVFETSLESQSFFDATQIPNVFVVGEIDGRVVLDMTSNEVEAVDSYYIISVDNEGAISNIEKLDGGPVTINRLGSLVSIMISMKENFNKF